MAKPITVRRIHSDVWWIKDGIFHDGTKEYVGFEILKDGKVVAQCQSEDEVKLYCLKNGYTYNGVDYCDY